MQNKVIKMVVLIRTYIYCEGPGHLDKEYEKEETLHASTGMVFPLGNNTLLWSTPPHC